jgi:cytochrome c553
MGRPPTGIGKSIGLRLYADQEAKLDAWIEAQPEPKPSKPEAIRRLLGEALAAKAVRLSGGR